MDKAIGLPRVEEIPTELMPSPVESCGAVVKYSAKATSRIPIREIVNEVSMAKWWTTDLQKKLTSECLQLHGGYGFMAEYPISQDYADAAVQSIYAGTNEIMKVLIARGLGLPGA